jgi:hypothetical protein
MNVFIWIFCFQKQQLCHYQVGHVIFHRTDQENDALFQQTRVDIERPLTASGLFDHHRDQANILWRLNNPVVHRVFSCVSILIAV